VGTEQETDAAAAAESLSLEHDIVMTRQRRAIPLVLALGVLAVGLPLAGIAASSLPDSLRLVVLGGLCIIGLLFAPLAVWWVGR
jgi:hypothetical protein